MWWWKRKPRPKIWISWRTKVYRRDKYECVICGRGKCRLDPHHILPKSLLPKLKYLVDNGASLCRKCHRKTFKRELSFVEILVTKIFGGLKQWKLLKHWQTLKKQRTG
jgi:5-methylcytosine-specific restriction endonuclease McrA